MMIFVSTGRCGTKRIAQILRENLPDNYVVTHQMRFSRIANIIGNVMYYWRESEYLKDKLYNYITSKYIGKEQYFITTDPLTAMIIPKRIYEKGDVCVVHIVREPAQFANSFFKFSRKRLKSFIAHNYIPFWQIGFCPMQNFISKHTEEKYLELAIIKNQYFETLYRNNPNYMKVKMDEIFETEFLSIIVSRHFGIDIYIPPNQLAIKVN